MGPPTTAVPRGPRPPRRRAAAALAAVLPAVWLAACGSAHGRPGPAPPRVPRRSPVATATPSPSPAPASPALRVPLVVQVENSPAARPQSGLAEASILYEYSAEGGISRFSALYFQPPAGQVGPVRSARDATVALCRLYDAVLLYSGASTYIQGRLQQAGIRAYDEDGAGGALYRVGTRSPPHNLYTGGGRIAGLLARTGDPTAPYAMWARLAAGAPLPPGGVPVRTVTAPVSLFERPVYSWSPADGGFLRTEPQTGPLVDAGTGRPLVVPTVVVMQVPVRPDPNVVDVNGAVGLDHTLTGSGPAQVFVDGLQYPATWAQGPGGPPSLALPGGAPAPVAPGEVAVELVPTGVPAVAR